MCVLRLRILLVFKIKVVYLGLYVGFKLVYV